MSIKGRPYAWFRAAIDLGDLAGIRAAAAEMPVDDLADALQILPVIARDEAERYERDACRWLARLTLERDVGLEGIRVALAALDQLPERPAATQILRRLRV